VPALSADGGAEAAAGQECLRHSSCLAEYYGAGGLIFAPVKEELGLQVGQYLLD